MLYGEPFGKKLISVDVEATGPTPGNYSMLSIGACVVGDTYKQFYRDIKPITDRYIYDYARIGCLELDCLKPVNFLWPYNARDPGFSPENTLEYLTKYATYPSVAMFDFACWLEDVCDGLDPLMIAAPIKFDGMYIDWYFDSFFEGPNPFGHSGKDLGSIYCGFAGSLSANMKNDKRFNVNNFRLHNALSDAVVQAERLEILMGLMEDEYMDFLVSCAH